MKIYRVLHMDRKNFWFWLPSRKSTRNRAIHKLDSNLQPIRELRKSTMFCKRIGRFFSSQQQLRKSTRNRAIYKVFNCLQYISDLRKSTVIYIWIGGFLIVGYKSENLQRNTLYIKSAPSSNTSVN